MPVIRWHSRTSGLRAIAALNLGLGDDLVDREFFTRPWSLEVGVDRLAVPKDDGFPWDDPSNVHLPPRNGVLVRLGRTVHCRSLELGLGGGAKYRLIFTSDGVPVPHWDTAGFRQVKHKVPHRGGRGLRRRTVEVPADVAGKGYDALVVFPVDVQWNPRHSVGWIGLCDG